MYFCLVIAFLMTFLWIDSLVVSSINARVNPYQKTDEDKNRDEKDAKKRTAYIVIASLFWAAVIFFF
jgi:hypothetical protein